MKKLIEKGFRQLFGIDVVVLNLPDADIAIYVVDKKLSKLTEKSLGILTPNFTILRIGVNFNLWVYRINHLDNDRNIDFTNESVMTYDTSDAAFAGLMMDYFKNELLMKFIERNI